MGPQTKAGGDLKKLKVAVSGANGFLGAALVERLLREHYSVQAFVRNPFSVDSTRIGVTSLLEPDAWQSVLRQCSVFIHCAARAHITSGSDKDALPQFRQMNTELTIELAQQAVLAGVERFIFISSIGVNGSESGAKPFRPDTANPQTSYALSKYEAELGLREISRQSGLEVVVIRPPLVYGPGAPGNFESLLRVLGRGWPLPLGAAMSNRRSFVALDNLIDLLVTCLHHPAAAHQTFLVSDGEDLSTADLLRRMGQAMGKPARLFYVPTSLLKLAAVVFRKEAMYQRLCGSLQVDISKTKQLLNWHPPLSVNEGLRRAAGEI